MIALFLAAIVSMQAFSSEGRAAASATSADQKVVADLVRRFTDPAIQNNPAAISLIRKKMHLVKTSVELSVYAQPLMGEKNLSPVRENIAREVANVDEGLKQLGLNRVKLTPGQFVEALRLVNLYCGYTYEVVRQGKTVKVIAGDDIGYISLEHGAPEAYVGLYTTNVPMFRIQLRGPTPLFGSIDRQKNASLFFRDIATAVREPSVSEISTYEGRSHLAGDCK